MMVCRVGVTLFWKGSIPRKSRVIYARAPMMAAQSRCANIDNLGDGLPPSTRTSTRVVTPWTRNIFQYSK